MTQRHAQIVQTVTATSMAELHDRLETVAGADLVELRLDGVADVDVRGAVAACRTPVIVTCRPVWEGGRFDGEEAVRRRLLADAVAAGADYVDIERRAEWMPDVRGTHTKVIVSDHDFSGIPADLTARVRAMRATGAAVVKVAAQIDAITDVFRLRDAVAAAGALEDTVVIGMGEAGHLTRMLPGRFGSQWTYAGDAAPGQLALSALREWYRIDALTDRTALYGVAGRPIAHSASPAMHNAAFRAAGIDAVYVPLLARTPDEVDVVARELGLAGVSLTAPLKTGWLTRPDVVADDEPARRLGAVNTLRRNGPQWEARNLDVAGFLDALDGRRIALRSVSAVVLGAGGAARGAVWALQSRGANVAVSARRPDAAVALAADLGVRAVPWPPRGPWTLLVNATPVGTAPAFDDALIVFDGCDVSVVYDLVYNPEETRLMRDAAAAGAQVIGGLDMLVGQAARQFAWWTGQPADVPVMRDAARRYVREMSGS